MLALSTTVDRKKNRKLRTGKDQLYLSFEGHLIVFDDDFLYVIT